MVQQVRAYGQVLQFPDDMSDDDMAKAIQNNEHVLNPNFKAPEGLSGIAKNVVSGTKQTGRMVGAGFDTIRNELAGVEDYAKASDIARQQETPIEQRKLLGELSSIDRDQGALRQIGDTLSAAGRNPMGTAQMITEQLPNTAVSLGGGYAGFKTGAAAGSLLGPVGAAIGGTLGFVSGMFLGNVLLEAGGKAIEKASDEDGFTPQDRDTSLREGAVKAAVITGVDAATFKIGGVLASKMGGAAIQAGAKAETKVLMDAGVDVASLTAINSALKASPELYRTARVAGEKAVLQSLSTGKKAAIIGTGVALETAGEGVGEYAGEYAATGKGDVVDATIEALSSATMSVAETAYNYNKVAIGNDLSPEGIKKVADNINERDVNEGVSNINKASSVDEAIKAANDVVSRKPTTSDDVLSSIDPTLKDIERLTGLKPSEAVARVINEAQQAQDSTQTQSQAKSILSGSSVSIQVPQPTNEAINEEEITKQKTDTEKSSGVLGRESEIVLPDGTSLPAQWQVVDADSVSASIKEGVNQPRDRTRAASDIQIQGIANNPDYRRLSDSPVMDVGAPVLSHNGLIVGGNGRFEGISRSHEQGSSSDYRDSLINDAINKGIDPSVIAGMKKPVLVRRITQPFDTRKLAIASNSGTSLQYSGLELAKIDAGRMAGIEDLDITDSGDIALTGSNIERLKMSLGDFSPAELSSLVGKNGELSQDGVKRVRNAMLAKAYGNSETLGRIVESTDGDMRNVLGALTKSAGVVAKARSEISAGAVPKEVDITDNLLDAVETFSQIRAKNQPLENYLAQQNMFGDGIDSDSQEILQFLHDNVRSQKKLTEFIKQVYDQITRIDQTTDNIFGDNSVPSKSEIIKNAKQRTEGQSTEQQQGIFAAKSSEEAGGSDGQESKTQADNAGSGEESQQDSGLNTETSKTVFDSFSALGNETGSAVQAMYDAEQITGLKLGIPIEYAKLGELIPARFDIARKIIEVNTNWFFTKAEGAQFIAEEILHYVDSVSNEKTISASSKLLDWDNGEIINELREHFESKGAYSTFLKYPIDNQEFRSLSIDRKKAEVFARMGVLYFGELDKLSHVLPKTYRAYHGIFKVTRDPVVEEISRKVWSFNPSPYRKVGGEYKSMGASLSSDGSFSGEGNSAELGRLREVIGLSFRAKPSGEKANLSDKSSLETKEAKFSRTAEERLKDRERAKQLERKLNAQGFNYTVTAKDVRDFSAGDRGKENEADAAEKIAKIFGRRIVWIEARGDHAINGVVITSIKDTIFIDVNTDKAAHAIMGHELSHHLEHDKPEVYKELTRSLMTVIRDHPGYANKYGIEGARQSDITKEIVGDIMGDNFTKPEFWNRVAEANPSTYKNIADTIISWLKRLIINAKARSLGSEQWVTDAQKAQDIVAKAIAQYTSQSNAPASGKAKFHSAFHGSPHDHDKFDSSKIGTGEGAQAYGYGHYFADSKDVAEFYKGALQNSSITIDGKEIPNNSGGHRNVDVIEKLLQDSYGISERDASYMAMSLARKDSNSKEDAIKYLNNRIEAYRIDNMQEAKEQMTSIRDKFAELPIKIEAKGTGKLYEVELAPEQDEYLLWDKPLSEQSDKVKRLLQNELRKHITSRSTQDNFTDVMYDGEELGSFEDHKVPNVVQNVANHIPFSGEDLYKGYAEKQGSDKKASEYLHSLGIRGIKYLDGSSRDKGEGAYNYVIFDDNDVSITAKFSRAPKLYSKLEQALEAANDKVFSTGSQVKLWLQSNAGKLGIKKDEIYWSGIDNWLDAQGKVSKQQVVEFVRNNGAKVEDVTLGVESAELLKRMEEIDDRTREISLYPRDANTAKNESDQPELDEISAEWEMLNDKLYLTKSPKHNNDKLTLPGGTDYKELVVTIPTIEPHNVGDTTHFGDTGQGKHIGWLRMNTRDGGLFIEELQSQRAQQGRSKGFFNKDTKFNLEARREELIAKYGTMNLGGVITAEERAELNNLKEEISLGIPPAPFVSDANNKATNAYITLLMKKALIEAVSNDHASVSWTTGDQQADRYDLSKQVDTIAYAFSKDRDTVTIQATKDNSFMYGKNNLPVAELADNFGKDIAKKITNDEGETNYQTGYKELSGLDLKTGGEWAQSMYGNDQGLNLQGKPSLISQAANDIFKHVGSGKVESINGQPGFYVTPEMRSKDLPLFSRVTSQDSEYLDAVNSGDMEKAQKLVNDKLANIGAYWHGTPSGDLRGGMTGLHVGTKQAAMEALEARIGIPADGRGWDGTREYGKTLLAGRDRVASGQFGKYRDSGYNVDSPKDDFYAEDHKLPTVGNDVKVDPSWKPWIRPVLIVGDMDKRKKTDSAANSSMYKLLSQGKATRGFYYENDGEDAGSVSAVLPNGDHVKIKLPDAVTYDDEGNVIPLSERFNKDNNDIRFSKEAIPEETTYQKTQRTVQDKFNRFSVIRDWLKERGVKLTELSNVYDAEERYHAKVANQVEDFREQIRNPLIEKIAKAGFTMDDIADYLEAQHAPEANEAIRKLRDDPEATAYGIADDEAKEYLSKAPGELGKLANELRSITEQTKKLRLDGGLLNKDITDAWEATYKHYIPVKGAEQGNSGTGKGMSVKVKNKRRLGHGRRDEAVIENILQDHERAIMEVEKNRVGKHVVMMAAEIGIPELMTIGQPAKRQMLRNTTAYEVQVKGRTKAVFDTKEGANLFRQSLPLTDKKIALSDVVINPTADQRVVMSASPMLADNEINVYIDGHAIRVQINDELMARAYKKLGIEGYGEIVSAGRMLNSYLSKVYTGYNPEFIMTNMVRDFTTGVINLTGEQGLKMAAKAISNYPKSFATLLRYAATNGKQSTDWIDAYRRNGGNTGAAYLSDMERLGNEVASEYAAYQGVIANLKQGDMANAARAAGRKAYNATLKWIYNLNQAGENAMRLSAFKAMIDSGMNVNDAAKAAKNITVNFNRKGELGVEANAAYLFFNASVQGTAATLHALVKGKNKYQAWALASGLTTLGYLAAASLGGGGEDDYDKIDDYTKERNAVIKYGDGYLKLPIPYGYGFFWNIGRSMADAQRKDELHTMPWHIAASAIEELTPFGSIVVGSDGEFKSDQVLGGALPTVAQIPYQISNNKQLFSGGELMPDSPFDQSQPDREKMWRGTKGTMYDQVSGWLAGAGMDVSPETLKFMTRTATGGAGALVDSSVSAAMLKADGAELDSAEMPFIRKAYKEISIKDTRSAFYKAREEAKLAAEEFNRARRKNDLVAMQTVINDKKEMLALDAYADKLSEVIRYARDQQDAVRLNKDIPIAEKRLRLKELEMNESKFYDKYLDVFNINKIEMKKRVNQ